MLLDACIPALEEAAMREARRPADAYGLKRITQQKRLEAVRAAVAATAFDDGLGRPA
jgi:hypothetical protein